VIVPVLRQSLLRLKDLSGGGVAVYEGGESRIVLGLGQVGDSSSMDEDSDVVLGLGQSEMRNYSGSANFCGETVHSGNAMSEILLARNQAEPGVLLRLNSMGDLHAPYGQQQQHNLSHRVTLPQLQRLR
jgi:hypothetical protein